MVRNEFKDIHIQAYINHLSFNLIQDNHSDFLKFILKNQKDHFFNEIYDLNFIIFKEFIKYFDKKKYKKMNYYNIKTIIDDSEHNCLINLINIAILKAKNRYLRVEI